MLAAQIAAVHIATMTFARRLNHVENIPQQDSAERAFNKLARTFAAQIEALKRYRTGGEQKVTVDMSRCMKVDVPLSVMSRAGGRGSTQIQRGQPHAKAISYAAQPSVWRTD